MTPRALLRIALANAVVLLALSITVAIGFFNERPRGILQSAAGLLSIIACVMAALAAVAVLFLFSPSLFEWLDRFDKFHRATMLQQQLKVAADDALVQFIKHCRHEMKPEERLFWRAYVLAFVLTQAAWMGLAPVCASATNPMDGTEVRVCVDPRFGYHIACNIVASLLYALQVWLLYRYEMSCRCIGKPSDQNPMEVVV